MVFDFELVDVKQLNLFTYKNTQRCYSLSYQLMKKKTITKLVYIDAELLNNSKQDFM